MRFRRHLILGVLSGLLLAPIACKEKEAPVSPQETPATPASTPVEPAPSPAVFGLSEGIECIEVAKGSGTPAADGMKVRVRVRVMGDERMLDDGELRFVLGEARTLLHVEEALRGMMPGGRRRFAGDPSVLYPGGVPEPLRNSPIVAVEIEYLGEE